VVAEEAMSNVRVVKAFSSEDKETQEYDKKMTNTYNLGWKRSMVYGIFQGATGFVANACILVVLYFGGKMVVKGTLTQGALGSFIIYTVSIAIASASVTAVLGEIINSLAACERVFEIMDYDPKIKYKNGERYQNFQGELAMREVDFHYPTKTDVHVLKKFNLTITPGEVIALVGSSGSGKSTIVSIIQRFYDVANGQFTIDGHDIKQLDLQWVHQNIGYVAQEPTLFSGTIEENIAYGVDKYEKEDLDRAAKLANAYDFIYNPTMFPQGYETVVGERGVKLSGGQKQRIAIARALIKRPKILIFDEATSALDAESEAQVQAAIDGIIQQTNTTVIIIAHRLSTIINCKRIIVLHEGQIAEEGTHQSLLATQGIYKNLIERQLQGFNS
jgi:ATP-binding cassette subfamily B (MDR/TAP) protein 9